MFSFFCCREWPNRCVKCSLKQLDPLFPSGRLDTVKVRLYGFYKGRLVMREISSVLDCRA